MTRGQIKSSIRQNLADNNITFYTEDDLNESLQDAYDDIASVTQCIVKTASNLPWQSNLTYYDFTVLGVPDYLDTIAIFNNVTNMWLRDDLNLRDFDRIRRDWEMWVGTPQFWAPSDPKHIAIAAKYIGTVTSGAFSNAFSPAFYISISTLTGTFNLRYAAIAPTFTSDSDVPLVSSDVQTMFEFYATADLFEQAEEFTKAQEYFSKYYETLEEYSVRVKRMNKADLLLRV